MLLCLLRKDIHKFQYSKSLWKISPFLPIIPLPPPLILQRGDADEAEEGLEAVLGRGFGVGQYGPFAAWVGLAPELAVFPFGQQRGQVALGIELQIPETFAEAVIDRLAGIEPLDNLDIAANLMESGETALFGLDLRHGSRILVVMIAYVVIV